MAFNAILSTGPLGTLARQCSAARETAGVHQLNTHPARPKTSTWNQVGKRVASTHFWLFLSLSSFSLLITLPVAGGGDSRGKQAVPFHVTLHPHPDFLSSYLQIIVLLKNLPELPFACRTHVTCSARHSTGLQDRFQAPSQGRSPSPSSRRPFSAGLLPCSASLCGLCRPFPLHQCLLTRHLYQEAFRLFWTSGSTHF